MADKLIQLGAGDYTVRDVVADTTSTVTVPVLTSGSIVQASPEVGDTLTVTGSNATAKATYQWQDSADGSTGWADITGATSVTLDTTALPAKFYRRGVTGLTQGPVYTAAVEVTAAAADILTYQSTDFASSINTTSVTFTGMAIGAASASREVVVSVAWNMDVSAPVTLTIGGVTATQDVINRTDSLKCAAVFRATVPTGTTADIVLTTSATLYNAAIYVYSGESLTVSATNSFVGAGTSATLDINTTAGGALITAFSAQGATGTVTTNQPNLRTQAGVGDRFSTADNLNTAAATPATVTFDVPTASGGVTQVAVAYS